MLVPEHMKLNQKEKKDVFDNYGVTFDHLPKILASDPGIAHLNAKAGDIIKIKRKSKTAGEAVFYRGVAGE